MLPVETFLIAVGVAAVLTPLVRSVALRHGMLDATGGRKVHTKPIPRIGGVAIVGGFYAAVAVLLIAHPGLRGQLMADGSGLIAMLVGGVAIAIAGFCDDLLDASARVKFSIQIAVACGLYAFGFRVTTLTMPWGVMDLGLLSLPVTVLSIVGVTNAVNLIDGLDGLAGGVSLIALAAVFFVGASRGDAFMMLFSAALGGAVLGFLFYNFNPATIFMGDTGSMFLGFMLAVCSIKAGQKSSTAVALFPVALLALPLCDTVVAMWRRLASGLPPFTGDREHFHHRLLARGLSHRHAVTTLYAVASIFATLAVVLYDATGWVLLGSIVGLVLMLHTLLSQLDYYRDLVPRRRTAEAVATAVALTRVQPPLATTQRRVLRRRVIPSVADASIVAVPRRVRRDSYIGD